MRDEDSLVQSVISVSWRRTSYEEGDEILLVPLQFLTTSFMHQSWMASVEWQEREYQLLTISWRIGHGTNGNGESSSRMKLGRFTRNISEVVNCQVAIQVRLDRNMLLIDQIVVIWSIWYEWGIQWKGFQCPLLLLLEPNPVCIDLVSKSFCRQVLVLAIYKTDRLRPHCVFGWLSSRSNDDWWC